LTMFRDGAAIADCTDNSGAANPDPCVSSRGTQGDDVQFVVLSSHASLWYLAIAQSSDVPVRVKRLVIKDNDTDVTKRSLKLKRVDASSQAIDLSCSGPNGGGATLEFTSTGSANHVSWNLPCSGWKRLGGKRGLTGSSYSDAQRTNGPCSKVAVRRGRKS